MMPAWPRAPGQDVEELPLQAGARQHAVDEVRPIERADELDGFSKPELRGDVAAHARGRRRGEGVQADAGKRAAQPAELPVLRPEVVPPLADAVRFVDGDELHVALREPGRGTRRCPRRPAARATRRAAGSAPRASRPTPPSSRPS